MYLSHPLKGQRPQMSLTVTGVFLLQSPCRSDLGLSLSCRAEESDETRSWKVDQCALQVSSDAGDPNRAPGRKDEPGSRNLYRGGGSEAARQWLAKLFELLERFISDSFGPLIGRLPVT